MRLKVSIAIGAAAFISLVQTHAYADEVTGVTNDTIRIGIPGPFSGNASSYSKAEIGLQAIELLETPEKSLVEHGAKSLRETTTRGALT